MKRKALHALKPQSPNASCKSLTRHRTPLLPRTLPGRRSRTTPPPRTGRHAVSTQAPGRFRRPGSSSFPWAGRPLAKPRASKVLASPFWSSRAFLPQVAAARWQSLGKGLPLPRNHASDVYSCPQTFTREYARRCGSGGAAASAPRARLRPRDAVAGTDAAAAAAATVAAAGGVAAAPWRGGCTASISPLLRTRTVLPQLLHGYAKAFGTHWLSPDQCCDEPQSRHRRVSIRHSRCSMKVCRRLGSLCVCVQPPRRPDSTEHRGRLSMRA